jgi:hypothetical protein
MQEQVRALEYVMSVHAEEEHVIHTGGIIERQKDQETGEWKYLIQEKECIDGL